MDLRETLLDSTPPPPQEWPPRWARTVAFIVGIGLILYETVVDHAAHLIVYGPAFGLTGLPLARSVEMALSKVPWGKDASAAPDLAPPPTVHVRPPAKRKPPAKRGPE